MRYYPVLVDLKDKRCLVVGGGRVALRKIRRLLECQARVFVVAQTLVEELKNMVSQGKIAYLGSEYKTEYLKGTFLLIGATDDEELNLRLSQEANEKGILCNIVDQPEKCNFIVPSLVTKGDLIITISTSGKSPALARRLRQEMEKMFGEEYALFLQILGKIRDVLKRHISSQPERQKILEALVYSDMIEKIKLKDWLSVEEKLKRTLPLEIPKTEIEALLRELHEKS